MVHFYDFLSLTGPFPKVALIHNSLFGVNESPHRKRVGYHDRILFYFSPQGAGNLTQREIKTDFSPFKSAKVNLKKLGLINTSPQLAGLDTKKQEITNNEAPMDKTISLRLIFILSRQKIDAYTQS